VLRVSFWVNGKSWYGIAKAPTLLKVQRIKCGYYAALSHRTVTFCSAKKLSNVQNRVRASVTSLVTHPRNVRGRIADVLRVGPRIDSKSWYGPCALRSSTFCLIQQHALLRLS
jgi:hypothetical protein